MSPTFSADIFHGELTAPRAQVFVRLPRTPGTEGCLIAGYVHGPFCEYAHTLPAKFTLQDLGPGPTLLARTTITDPCLWTSDLPQLYNVHVELRRDNQTIATEKRQLGLRGIGIRTATSGGHLLREGKVWVPRGCSIQYPTPDHIEALREQLLVGICESPALDLLAEASRRGLYLIAKFDAEHMDPASTLSQLARWPAVMMAVISNGKSLPRELTQAAPNILLAQAVNVEGLPSLQPALWAQAIVASLDVRPVPPISFSHVQLPLLFERSSPHPDTSEGPREACDRLQRELAPLGQFAGYMVAF